MSYEDRLFGDVPQTNSGDKKLEKSIERLSVKKGSPEMVPTVVVSPANAKTPAFKKPSTKAEWREFQEKQRADKAAKMSSGNDKRPDPQKKHNKNALRVRSNSGSEAINPQNQSKGNKKGNKKSDKENRDSQGSLLSHLDTFEKNYEMMYSARAEGLIHPAVMSFGRHLFERTIVKYLLN